MIAFTRAYSSYVEDGTYSICFYTYTSDGKMVSASSDVSVVSPNMTEITLLNAEYAAEISATERNLQKNFKTFFKRVDFFPNRVQYKITEPATPLVALMGF